jgi:hypothetical protein
VDNQSNDSVYSETLPFVLVIRESTAPPREA